VSPSILISPRAPNCTRVVLVYHEIEGGEGGKKARQQGKHFQNGKMCRLQKIATGSARTKGIFVGEPCEPVRGSRRWVCGMYDVGGSNGRFRRGSGTSEGFESDRECTGQRLEQGEGGASLNVLG